MTDFLANVAGRALDRAPVLRRRRPSLFEPSPDAPAPAHLGTTRRDDDDVVPELAPAPAARARRQRARRTDPVAATPRVEPETDRSRLAAPRAATEARRSDETDAAATDRPSPAPSEERVVRRESSSTARPDERASAPRRAEPADRVVETTVVERRTVRETVVLTPERRPEAVAIAPPAVARPQPAPALRVSEPAIVERPRADEAPPAREPGRSPERDLHAPVPAPSIRPALVAMARSTPSRAERARAGGAAMSTAAPTIQVTIGRIEVRGTPASSSKPAPRSAAPTLSLDEYLRSRGGGRP